VSRVLQHTGFVDTFDFFLDYSTSAPGCGQKRDSSPHGGLIGKPTSAAMITTVIYQPRIAAMKSTIPETWGVIVSARFQGQQKKKYKEKGAIHVGE
jgi:hypothetical protein